MTCMELEILTGNNPQCHLFVLLLFYKCKLCSSGNVPLMVLGSILFAHMFPMRDVHLFFCGK